MKLRLLTKEEREKIRDDWFKSLPRGDGKLPRDLELEAQRDLTKREIVEWGNRFCVVIEHYGSDKRANTRKRECRKCWQALEES